MIRINREGLRQLAEILIFVADYHYADSDTLKNVVISSAPTVSIDGTCHTYISVRDALDSRDGNAKCPCGSSVSDATRDELEEFLTLHDDCHGNDMQDEPEYEDCTCHHIGMHDGN